MLTMLGHTEARSVDGVVCESDGIAHVIRRSFHRRNTPIKEELGSGVSFGPGYAISISQWLIKE